MFGRLCGMWQGSRKVVSYARHPLRDRQSMHGMLRAQLVNVEHQLRCLVCISRFRAGDGFTPTHGLVFTAMKQLRIIVLFSTPDHFDVGGLALALPHRPTQQRSPAKLSSRLGLVLVMAVAAA